MSDLIGRTALITGVSRGIGRATATAPGDTIQAGGGSRL
jgi:NAD(P)-dependent dehydrogenase (short-subunit alcohol dehydrogenase family)